MLRGRRRSGPGCPARPGRARRLRRGRPAGPCPAGARLPGDPPGAPRPFGPLARPRPWAPTGQPPGPAHCVRRTGRRAGQAARLGGRQPAGDAGGSRRLGEDPPRRWKWPAPDARPVSRRCVAGGVGIRFRRKPGGPNDRRRNRAPGGGTGGVGPRGHRSRRGAPSEPAAAHRARQLRAGRGGRRLGRARASRLMPRTHHPGDQPGGPGRDRRGGVLRPLTLNAFLRPP